MQHIKSIMTKIDAIISNDKQPSKKTDVIQTGDNKSLRIIAMYVKGIREAREEMLNARK
jgi:hypothetical protein